MSARPVSPEEQVRELHDEIRTLEREEAAARAAVSEAIGDKIDRAAATAEAAAQSVNNTYETAAATIRAHPFAAVLGAAAAGFILGRVLR